MKAACVLIAHLPARVELIRRAPLRGRPVAIAAKTALGTSVEAAWDDGGDAAAGGAVTLP